MNPSTQDLVEAIERLPQQEVLVLPNNSNIMMAARQAQSLVDKQVEVIPTRTVPQGVAAILALNYEQSFAANVKAMGTVINQVRTIEITTAVRDAVVDDTEVREGQTIGLLDDKLISAGDDQQAVVDKMLDSVEMTTMRSSRSTWAKTSQKSAASSCPDGSRRAFRTWSASTYRPAASLSTILLSRSNDNASHHPIAQAGTARATDRRKARYAIR